MFKQNRGISALNIILKSKKLMALLFVLLLTGTAFADGLSPDVKAPENKLPGVTAAPNGVPLIDIAKPNSQGLSHNLFREFSVKKAGAILNNSNKEASRSVLGGIVPGNPNLKDGTAKIILNEVTGHSRSQLKGYLEVHGDRADVIVANPNGITCNGCGFINSPHATLTTGIPELDGNGNLTGFLVENGEIRFEGLGGKFDGTDIVDILSRKIYIDGRIDAKTLNLIAGHNRINYADGTVTSLSAASSNDIVIDSTLLGGMYAERISILATQQGTGVRVRGDMATSVGELTLKADGSLTFGNISSAGKLSISSTRKGISGKKISARKKIDVQAQETITLETVTSDDDVLLDSVAGGVTLTDLSAGGKISISGLNDVAFNLIKSNEDIALTSSSGDVTGAEITSKDALTVNAGGKLEITGDIVSESSDISLTAGAVITYNRLSAGQDAFLAAGGGDISLDKETRVGRNLELSSSSALLDWRGKVFDNISAPGLVTITAQNADLSNGTFRFSEVLLSITNNLNLSGSDVKNGKDSSANITINAGSISTSAMGELIAENNLYLTLSQSSTNRMIIGSLGDTVVTMTDGANLTNEESGVVGARENLGLFLSGNLLNSKGTIITQNGDLIVAGIESGIAHSASGGFVIGDVNDLADISTDARQAVKLENSDGLIQSGRDLIIAAQEVENSRDGAASTKAIHAQNDLSIISAGNILNNGGLLTADNDIHLRGANLNNTNLAGATGEIIANNLITGDFTGLIDNVVIVEQTDPNHINSTVNLLGSLISFTQLSPLSAANGDQTSSGTQLDSLASLTNIASGDSLFQLSSGDSFIFETRLEFINLDAFYGSAYFLERIQYDQEEDVKFIGDAYFETKLVEQAILDQTGEKFLDATASTATEQFKKLLDSGAETQEELDLKLGVALTSVQINALTKNIVWYVERTVNGQKVLVPEVYLAKRKSFELVKNGALIKAKDVLLKSQNGIKNRGGRITTSGDLSLISEGGTIHLVAQSRSNKKYYDNNNRGQFSSGGNLTLLAGQSVNIEGFKLHSTGNLDIRAKDNVAIKSYQIKKRSGSVSTKQNLLSVLTTNSDATIVAESGDLTVTGALISAGKHINLAAGNDIGIFAVQDTYSKRSGGGRRHEYISRTTYQKNKISAGQSLTTHSQRDTEIQASQLEAGTKADGNLTILGGRNVAIVSGENVYDYDYYHKKKKWYGKTSVTHIRRHKEKTISSRLKSGGDVTILSKGDVDIGASNVEAGNNLRVAAGVDVDEYISSQTPEELAPSGEEGNVNILTNEEIDSYYKYRKKSGFFAGSGKGSFSFGYKKEKHTTKSETATQVLSYLSAGKDVIISATGDINADAPLIVANDNIELRAGRDIQINSIYDLFRYHESHKVSQFGVTVSLFENVTSSFKALKGLPKAFSSGKGSSGAKAITAASATLRAIDAVNSLAGGQVAGARLALGISKSKSSYDQNSISSKGAIIRAGKDVKLKAGRDISIEGASITANDNVELDAKRDLSLNAGKNTRAEKSSSKSSSLGVSVSVGVTIVGGVGISAGIDGSFNKAKSSANSTDYTYAQIQAGKKATLKSGRDTKLKGAQVGAKTIIATIGRDLTVESLQNTSSYKSSSVGFSFGLSTDLGGYDSGVNITPNNLLNHALGNGAGPDVPVNDRAVPIVGESGYRGAFGQLLNNQGLISKGQLLDGGQPNGLQLGGTGWNVGFSISKGKGQFTWVEQQSRLLADGKVDITVKEHTQLIAGVIASRSKDLTLDTGTIGYRDLVDVDKSKDYGGSLSLSGPLSKGGNKSQEKSGNPSDLGFSVDGSYSSKNKEGVTRATVGEGEITIRDTEKQKELEDTGKTQKLANLNRDLDKAQEVTKDEETEINLYVSDSSIKTAAKVVEVAGKSFEKVFDELASEIADLLNGTKEAKNAYEKAAVALKKKTNASEDELKKATELLATEEGQELIQEKLKTEEGRQQVAEYLKSGGCSSGGGQQGSIWSPLDLLITPAYADGGASAATVCLASGPPGWVIGAAIVVVGGTVICLQNDCLSGVSNAIGSLLNSQSNSGDGKKPALLPADTYGTPSGGPEDPLFSAEDIATNQLNVSSNAARRNLRNNMNTQQGEVAHHLIPWQARSHPLIQQAARGGFNVNGRANGMNLPGRVGNNLASQRGGHVQYNRMVINRLNRMHSSNPNMTNAQAAQAVRSLADKMRPIVQRRIGRGLQIK